MYKYYVYVSEAKLDMLFAQIPHEPKQKITTEIKGDAKIASMTRKVEKDIDVNIYTKLAVVIEFIKDYSDVGTIENPGVWISVVEDMNMEISGIRDRVLWTGEVNDTFVVLNGSKHHVIGAPRESQELPPSLRQYSNASGVRRAAQHGEARNPFWRTALGASQRCHARISS